MNPPAPHPAVAPPSDGRIRPVVEADRDAVIAIRDEAIRTSWALWIEEVPTREAARAWFAGHLAGGTMLVAELAEAPGQPVGFASFSPLREYDGYRLTAEDSVYLAPQAQGHGLGRALLEGLVVRAADDGMHSLIGMIEASNTPSVRLHGRCGFTQVGLIPQAGLKRGRWLDLAIWQRLL